MFSRRRDALSDLNQKRVCIRLATVSFWWSRHSLGAVTARLRSALRATKVFDVADVHPRVIEIVYADRLFCRQQRFEKIGNRKFLLLRHKIERGRIENVNPA